MSMIRVTEPATDDVLISIEDVIDTLGLDISSTSIDEEEVKKYRTLSRIVKGASVAIESYIGRILRKQSYTERVPGYDNLYMQLTHNPVGSVESISYSEVGQEYTLGPIQNVFGSTATASKAEAEVLRDAYALANPAWLTSYNDNSSYYIRLVWSKDTQAHQRRNVDGTGWENVTNGELFISKDTWNLIDPGAGLVYSIVSWPLSTRFKVGLNDTLLPNQPLPLYVVQYTAGYELQSSLSDYEFKMPWDIVEAAVTTSKIWWQSSKTNPRLLMQKVDDLMVKYRFPSAGGLAGVAPLPPEVTGLLDSYSEYL